MNDILNTIITVPPSDANFKNALHKADSEILSEALTIAAEAKQKTRYNAIRSRLNAYIKECLAESECGPFTPEPTYDEALAEIHRRRWQESTDADHIVSETESFAGVHSRLAHANIATLLIALERASDPSRKSLITSELEKRGVNPPKPNPTLSQDTLAGCDTRLIDEPAEPVRTRGEKRSATNSTPETTNPTTLIAAPGGEPESNSEQPAQALAVVAPGTISTVKEESIFSDDAISAFALTEQYQRAVGGMREVLKFGVMMMQLRDNLFTREQVSVGGRGNKDGVSEWLRTNAPDINRTTAYRFLHVAEAIAAEFQTPAKVNFIELVTTAPESLTEKLQLKQAELWDFVDGTSQRSWLDRFAPAKPRTYHPPKPKTNDDGTLPEEPPSGWLPHLWARYRTLTVEQRLAWDMLYIPAFKVFAMAFDDYWGFLPDKERDEMDGWLLDMRSKFKAAREEQAAK